MADNKKYYYLKLKDNFFESDNMILLETMQDGYLYSNILLKLYLRSLKDEGRLMLNGRIPFSPQMLATITRHQVGTIEKAIQLFKELGLIDILDNGAIYLSDIQNYIGHSSTEADRQREYYNRIKGEQNLLTGEVSKKSCKKSYKKSCKKSTPEIEIDLDKDTDTKKNIEDFFEKLWELYPKKEGKGSVADKKKKELYEIGYEHLERCIERYKDKIARERTERKFIKQGSSFFNTGYIDYLDKNYKQEQPTSTSPYRRV